MVSSPGFGTGSFEEAAQFGSAAPATAPFPARPGVKKRRRKKIKAGTVLFNCFYVGKMICAPVFP